MSDAILVFVVLAIAIALWFAWYFNCLFLFHVWDKSRSLTDVCKRCGSIRFK